MVGDAVHGAASSQQASPCDAAPRWGVEIATESVKGHPLRVYRHRPRAVNELLVDARRWHDRLFIVQGDRRLTYAQHEAAVARVARALATWNIGRGDRVLLLGFNSVEWHVAFWALQCVGAVAVLGNAWWNDLEVRHAADLVGLQAIVTDREQAAPGGWGAAVVPMAEVRRCADTAEAVPLMPAAVSEDDPAVIIFSSGTTGQPKGVQLSQRSVVANIQNLLALTRRMPNEIAPEHDATVSLLTVPLFHLAGIQISFSTLLSGGRLVFLEGKFDPLKVLALIERERVRVWGSVPTMVSRVINHPDFSAHDSSSVTSIPMGGAAVSPELRVQVREAFPNIGKRVGSLYGLTEAGGVLAAGSGSDLEGRPGCVGRPLPVVEIRLRDVDASGVGEIMARTPTMTDGYLGDPAPLTDAEGWLGTGDLGRIDADGYLYVVGRSKDIIIRGGENVAAANVERCLQRFPGVAEVAVVALPHADLGEEVGAVLVPQAGATLNVEALRVHARSQLAHFEVPSRWWLRDERLPTNASGKVLKKALVAQWPEGGEVQGK